MREGTTPTNYAFIAWFTDHTSVYKCYLLWDGRIVSEDQSTRVILPLTWHKINGQVMIAHVSFPKSRPAVTLPVVFDAGVMTGSKELAEALHRLLRLVLTAGEESALRRMLIFVQHDYNDVMKSGLAAGSGLFKLFDLPTEPAPEKVPEPPTEEPVVLPPAPTQDENEDDDAPSTGEDYVVG